MRSAILVGFAVFIAVLIGGYSLTWYSQATATKHAIEQSIAAINSKQPLITYDKLEMSGFPTQVNIVMSNPRFSGRMDTLMQQISDWAEKSGTKIYPTPVTKKEFLFDTKLNGQIIFGISAFSDYYTMQTIGNWSSNSKVDGKSFATTYNSSGGTFCSLQLQRSASIINSLWNYETLARDMSTLIHDFRMFDCAFPSSTATQNEKTIMQVAPIRFYISNAPIQDIEHMRIYLNVAGIEVTPFGDEVLTTFVHALDPNKSFPQQHMSAYGKELIDIDFSYNGPANLKEVANPNLEISLGKFDISNDIYKTHLAFFLNNAFDGTQNHIKLTWRGDANFTPQYDALLRETISAAIHEAYTTADPRFMEFQASMQQFTPDQMTAFITPAIPNLSSLGNIVESIDLEYSGDPKFSSGEATLHDLEFSTTPYGIKGNGIAKREKGGQPSGQMGLTCTNCAQMIDDIFGYISKFNAALMYISPEKATALTPNPQLAQGIKSFLLQLSGPDKVNWTYDIVGSQQTGITINGKPLATIFQLYGQYVIPLLKKNAASQPSLQH